ncbi:hypothetical protein [uncultured Brevundimonas sp.]|uniref:hypothetical protein n=1 Tax=uncultured Brevundimonas sp. TaxID=213418 RepID=UPI0030EC0F14
MTQIDPDTESTPVPPPGPVYSETVETVVVRDSNTGWWIAGVLGGLVLIAAMWILFAGREPDDANARMLEAQAASDAALVQGQMTAAQASVDIARADAARAQAEAIRSSSDARAAEARSTTPPATVVITSPPPSTGGQAVVTPTAPQN